MGHTHRNREGERDRYKKTQNQILQSRMLFPSMNVIWHASNANKISILLFRNRLSDAKVWILLSNHSKMTWKPLKHWRKYAFDAVACVCPLTIPPSSVRYYIIITLKCWIESNNKRKWIFWSLGKCYDCQSRMWFDYPENLVKSFHLQIFCFIMHRFSHS